MSSPAELSGQAPTLRTPLDLVRHFTRSESAARGDAAALVTRAESAAVFEPDAAAVSAGVSAVRRAARGAARSAATDFDVEAAFYARRGDAPRAAALLESFVEWRARVGDANPVSCEEVRELLRIGAYVSPGTRDRDGRAVVYARICRMDCTRFCALDMVRTVYFVYMYTLRKFPWAKTHGIVLMQDMNQVQLSKIDRRAPAEMRKAVSQTLPVRVASINVLSPPSWIRLIFSIVSKFLGDKMKARLRVIPDSQAMAEIIEPDQMLSVAELGGTLEWSEAIAETWLSEATEECKSWPGINLSPIEEQIGQSK